MGRWQVKAGASWEGRLERPRRQVETAGRGYTISKLERQVEEASRKRHGGDKRIT